MGLSLWLVPTDEGERAILEREMQTLRESNSDTASAAFPPHATLLAGIQTKADSKGLEETWATLLDGLQQWRKGIGEQHSGPLRVKLDRVTTKGLYFQCILIALKHEEALLSLNAQMRQAFSLQDQPLYFPHVSLLYSSIDSTTAEEQIRSMESQGVFRSSATNELVFGSGPKTLTDISFGAIELWSTNGPVDKWEKVRSVQI